MSDNGRALRRAGSVRPSRPGEPRVVRFRRSWRRRPRRAASPPRGEQGPDHRARVASPHVHGVRPDAAGLPHRVRLGRLFEDDGVRRERGPEPKLPVPAGSRHEPRGRGEGARRGADGRARDGPPAGLPEGRVGVLEPPHGGSREARRRHGGEVHRRPGGRHRANRGRRGRDPRRDRGRPGPPPTREVRHAPAR